MIMGMKKSSAKETSDEGSKDTGDAQEMFPLFYSKPVPLDSEKHGQAGLSAKGNYDFARVSNSVPANVGEFALLSKFYPIIFIGDKPMPIAVVGFENANVMIDKEGNWAEDAYIPAYVRRYPFVLVSTKDKEKFFLAVDEGADSYMADKADRTFYEKGDEPGDLLDNAMKFCQAFQGDHEATQRLCVLLEKEDLLMPNQVSVQFEDGKQRVIAGFKTINAEKLRDLPDATFLQLRKDGWLPYLYAHLMSLDNWQRLSFYARKHGIKITPPAKS